MAETQTPKANADFKTKELILSPTNVPLQQDFRSMSELLFVNDLASIFKGRKRDSR